MYSVLPTLDGKALFTVEDLHSLLPVPDGTLHPVQQAMVDMHGSQCGFVHRFYHVVMVNV